MQSMKCNFLVNFDCTYCVHYPAESLTNVNFGKIFMKTKRWNYLSFLQMKTIITIAACDTCFVVIPVPVCRTYHLTHSQPRSGFLVGGLQFSW